MQTVLNRKIIEEALYRADLTYHWDKSDDELESDGGFDGYGTKDYSGRAMYGDHCFGIVHDRVGSLLRFVAAIGEAAETLGIEHPETTDLDWINSASQDSMGRSAITYFPGVTVSE